MASGPRPHTPSEPSASETLSGKLMLHQNQYHMNIFSPQEQTLFLTNHIQQISRTGLPFTMYCGTQYVCKFSLCMLYPNLTYFTLYRENFFMKVYFGFKRMEIIHRQMLQLICGRQLKQAAKLAMLSRWERRILGDDNSQCFLSLCMQKGVDSTFLLCVLRCHVMQHEKKFEKMHLASFMWLRGRKLPSSFLADS